MARAKIFEGTWEELTAHADEFRMVPKLTLIVPEPGLQPARVAIGQTLRRKNGYGCSTPSPSEIGLSRHCRKRRLTAKTSTPMTRSWTRANGLPCRHEYRSPACPRGPGARSDQTRRGYAVASRRNRHHHRTDPGRRSRRLPPDRSKLTGLG